MSFYQSLSGRLKLLTILWVTVAVTSIGLTLRLSWMLEGGAAAINDAGSLRMQTYRLALLIQEHQPADQINQKIQYFDAVLANLERGDPRRPLFLPDTENVHQAMLVLKNEWNGHMRPTMQQAAQTGQAAPGNAALQQFVGSIDHLVLSVEEVNARYIQWLRVFQTGLIMMVMIGAVVMVHLLYRWIIHPVERLRHGVGEISGGTFGVQIPLDHATEFAQLGDGFNRMSTRLQQLYGNLEQEVAEKTGELAQKNDTLQTLYDFSRLLSQTQSIAEASEEFLNKIKELIPIKAGSIRLIDRQRKQLDLVAHIGLPHQLQSATACKRFDTCRCGQAVEKNSWQPISFSSSKLDNSSLCQQLGMHFLQLIPIRHNEQELGVMTLYFEKPYNMPHATENLLNTLCSQLGMLVSNMRLAEESRQLAVLQERNLMAQGLHDSIAQTLNYLNLQVQMLESALAADEAEQADENLQFIKTGVQECYEDVRELLLNFRTKLSSKDFIEATESLVTRFEQQTQATVDLHWQGDGAPLNSDQQLQFIFILQESLSNIRKHAQATRVDIWFDNRQDVVMRIRDNGKGFSAEPSDSPTGTHVGLNIMRERASRIRADLKLSSRPGQTEVCLTLPQQERILA